MKKHSTSTHRGHITLLIIAGCIVVGLIGAVGLAFRGGSSSVNGDGQPDTFAARRGEFEITLPVSGELAALQQIEIRNRLEKEAVITEIIAEGVWANTGDVLLKLNDEELRNEVKDGVDDVNVAEAAAVAASSDLDITVKERESELSKADLAIRLAELALNGWKEGEDKSRRRELSLDLETAQKDAERLQARFKESTTLLEKKFISLDEYKQDEIEMIKANAALEQAQLEIELYEKYQFEQEKAEKESDLEQAIAERARTEQSFDAKVRTAQSDLESKKYQLQSKRDRLRLKEQELAKCTIIAPSPGLVVYNSSLESGMRWGGNEGPPQVGTQLYPNQQVIILPDTSKMVAAVKVSEALSGLIKTGQRATVTSDAMPDRTLEGTVQSVGVLAESGGWRDPNRRDYTVKILLTEGSDLGLKPSMRCKANIHIGRVDDTLHIPIQAVFRNGAVSYVYVPERSGYAQRKVTLGRSSELFIEVADGIAEGDIVLLREPQPEEIVSRIAMPKASQSGKPRSAPAEGTDQNAGELPQPTGQTVPNVDADATSKTPASDAAAQSEGKTVVEENKVEEKTAAVPTAQ